MNTQKSGSKALRDSSRAVVVETVGNPREPGIEKRPRIQTIAAVLWPSFLAGALSTSMVFAFVDPAERFLEFDRIAVYSFVFLAIWFTSILAAWGAVYALKPVPARIEFHDELSSGSGP